MKVSATNRKTTEKARRKSFLSRTALDTVASFKLEGIIISIDEAYRMAEEALAKAEKEGRLIFA